MPPRDAAQIRSTALVVGTLHLGGWGLLMWSMSVSSRHALSLGLGLTAYLFGMRHAFDADHIAAIDNTSRKLLADGKRPITAGLFFSLGHASVVFLLTLCVALVSSQFGPQLSNPDSPLRNIGGLLGSGISALFLFAIAALNSVVLRQTLRRFRVAQESSPDSRSQENLRSGGFMTRLFGKRLQAINHSWQLYPIGFLFGLGFDTASEIGLLALAATAAAGSASLGSVICLPILFAAGMALFDSADAIFMVRAYSWAFSSSLRKLYYNATMTGLSIAIASLVGIIELAAVLVSLFHLHTGPLSWISAINLNVMGLGIVGLFAVTWAGAWLIWRHRGFEASVWSGLADSETRQSSVGVPLLR